MQQLTDIGKAHSWGVSEKSNDGDKVLEKWEMLVSSKPIHSAFVAIR